MPDINDIILRKKEGDEFFNVYKPIEEIGGKIFDSFKKIYTPGKGFPLSQKDLRYGTLSNIMALSTLLDINNMDIDMVDFQDSFRFVLKTVFDTVYKNGYNASLVFDATPFLDAQQSDEFDSYVETASKVLATMVDLRQYAHKNNLRKNPFGEPIVLAGKNISSFYELAIIAEKLLIDCISFLNKAVLTIKESEIRTRTIENKVIDRDSFDSEIKYRGWTFCDPEGESDEYSTSIYYTYHVSNAFVSFYNAHSNLFDRIFYDTFEEGFIKDKSEEEKELYKIDETFILNNKAIINEFRVKVNSSGRYIENILLDNGVDIVLDFIKSDFTKISFSDVIGTQDKNSVTNTLFTIAIFLNSGIDEDYEYISKKERLTKDKDWFYNQLLFSISNIKKIYNILKTTNKQEIVDSFSLSSSLLNEKYPSHYNSLVQQLRKGSRNVAVYDLIPLLCNTYSIVFNYIVKYPQLDMVDNLEMIMENCLGNEWLWGDVDGFNVNNNLYYIFALENFYDYYEKYEVILTRNKKEYNRIVKEKQAEYETKIQEERERNKELEDKVKQLENVLSEKKSNLDKEVEILAKSTFESVFEEKFTDCLDKMLLDATMFYIDSITKNKTSAQALADFKEDKRLRVALALYSSIDFVKVAIGSGADFAYLAKYDTNGILSDQYLQKMNEQVNTSIAENVEKVNKGE